MRTRRSLLHGRGRMRVRELASVANGIALKQVAQPDVSSTEPQPISSSPPRPHSPKQNAHAHASSGSTAEHGNPQNEEDPECQVDL